MAAVHVDHRVHSVDRDDEEVRSWTHGRAALSVVASGSNSAAAVPPSVVQLLAHCAPNSAACAADFCCWQLYRPLLVSVFVLEHEPPPHLECEMSTTVRLHTHAMALLLPSLARSIHLLLYHVSVRCLSAATSRG